MSRSVRRAAVASLVVGLTFAGPAAVAADQSNPLRDLLDATDVGRVMRTDLPAITGDVDNGLGGLLGDGGLLDGVLGGTDDLLAGLLGGLGLGSDPDLTIQPVPPGGNSFAEPNVGGGLLESLFGVSSIADSLAGRL